MTFSLYLLLGLFAGVISGLLGIGGGTIIIPALIYLFGLTQHQAQGTTVAIFVLPIGLLAAWTYYQHGNVDFKITLFIALGFFLGALAGARFAHLISDLTLKRLFGIYLLLVALRMLWGK